MAEATKYNCSNFYEAKTGMVDLASKYLHRWKLGGNEVPKFRPENFGENKKLDKKLNLKYWKLSAKFECTPLDAPQRNYLAKTGFAKMYIKGNALIFDENLPRKCDTSYSRCFK